MSNSNSFPDDGVLRFANGTVVGGSGGAERCPDCNHPKRKHGSQFGCEGARGSGATAGAEILQHLLGPCGCMRWTHKIVQD